MSNNKVGLITGVTGQDGSYLAELLLSKDYSVVGMVRRNSTDNTERIRKIMDNPKFQLVDGDLTDEESLTRILEFLPSTVEIYNFAANSFVGSSWSNPALHMTVNAVGVAKLLNAARRLTPKARIVLAGSSEQFGKSPGPQNESTVFMPRSPYGVSKVAQFHLGVNYRESYGMHISNAISFNHESRRRGAEFVTQKIVRGMCNYLSTGNSVVLGNLEAKRDWSHAKDIVYGMWLMTQQDVPDDYVLASCETTTVRRFCEVAANALCRKMHYGNMSLVWNGNGLDETGWLMNLYGERLSYRSPAVKISKEFFRPAEVDLLLGDATKAKTKLGWKPSYTFEMLVDDMVDGAIDAQKR